MTTPGDDLRQLLANEVAAVQTYRGAIDSLGTDQGRELTPLLRPHQAAAKAIRGAMGPTTASQEGTSQTHWSSLPHRELYGRWALLDTLRRGELEHLRRLADILRSESSSGIKTLIRRTVLPRLRGNPRTLRELAKSVS